MAIESDLRTLLLTFSPVTALVGTGDTARIRPYVLDESDDDTEESIVIEVDDEEHLNSIDGVAGLTIATVNVLCRSRTLSETEALAEAVRLNGTNPGTGLAGYTGTPVADELDIVLEHETKSVVPVRDGSDESYYDINQQYMISRNETA